MHDVFHVLVLRHYISYSSHVIDMSSLQVSGEGDLIVDPIRIVYHHTRYLQGRLVDQVKVDWDNYSPHSPTWEDAHEMLQ
jgi:hypothetical protein